MTVRDQTGATWEILGGTPVLVSENPSPKMGKHSLGVPIAGLLLLRRDDKERPQWTHYLPEAVEEGRVVLDVWHFYVNSLSGFYNLVVGKSAGRYDGVDEPITTIRLQVLVGFQMYAIYDKWDQGLVIASAPWLPEYENTWVNLRAVLNNSGISLIINGVTVAFTEAPNELHKLFPVNLHLKAVTDGIYVGESRAAYTKDPLGANYPPRTVQWPNPPS